LTHIPLQVANSLVPSAECSLKLQESLPAAQLSSVKLHYKFVLQDYTAVSITEW